MLLNVLKKDFLRKKVITIALFVFILLSALLVAGGSSLTITLLRAIDDLFTKADVPHFVQMHSGKIDQAVIDRWVLNNPLVEKQQSVEMLNIDGADIYFGDDQASQEDSVMDFDFVKQNSAFDFLLDLENREIQVNRGEIAVPVYFKQRANLQIGDNLKISSPAFNAEFTISAFVRDALMNPTIVSSKRFVVNESDFEMLKQNLGHSLGGETEYLIEFQLKDFKQLDRFVNEYQSSDLPQKGPPLDYNLFKSLNALTDGVVVAVIALISILLMAIAMLCLRFTILMTIEEDYTEIGVMKAIGIRPSQIRKIYLAKYISIAAAACLGGYLLSFVINQQLLGNVILYIGTAPQDLTTYLITYTSVMLVFLIVVFFCMLMLRRFNKISAIAALRSGSVGKVIKNRALLSLGNNEILPVNIFLGVRDIVQRFGMFQLLFVIFFLCTLILIIPLNFLNTIQSPDFVTYTGVARSDIRIDLQPSNDLTDYFNKTVEYLRNDSDIERFVSLATYQFKVLNEEGGLDNINVEVGDFSLFPLEYLQGSAPSDGDQISLSYLNANELKKKVGDQVELVMNGQKRSLTVSGIYQDVTNGGKTAKAANPPFDSATPLRYVVILNLNPGIDLQAKVNDYSEALYPAKVTDVSGYVAQTFANVIQQVRWVTRLAFIIATIIAILVTSLFLQMLIAKDFPQIAILKSLGFSLSDIRIQYLTRSLLVLNLGIVVGTIISNTFGQSLVSVLMSFMGAPNIHFVIDPLQAYVFLPLTLLIVVTITTLMSITTIRTFNIARIIRE